MMILLLSKILLEAIFPHTQGFSFRTEKFLSKSFSALSSDHTVMGASKRCGNQPDLSRCSLVHLSILPFSAISVDNPVGAFFFLPGSRPPSFTSPCDLYSSPAFYNNSLREQKLID